MECDHCIIRLQPSRDQAVALIALEHEVPSAVILDHALSDGERSQLRDLLKERNIPYVVHSGYAAPERGDAAGNDVNVPKPASPQLLITKVAGLLYSEIANLARERSAATPEAALDREASPGGLRDPWGGRVYPAAIFR